MGNQWQRGTVQVWKTMFQNVSYLGFDLSHQNLQWVQYARGFMDLKGKTAWQGSPPGSGRRLSLALLRSGSCQGPCKLSHSGLLTPSGRGLLTRQSGGVILPTWHHFDHLRKQTNKRKTKQQKCMLAAGCLEGSFEASASWPASMDPAPRRAHVGGRTPLPRKLTHGD